MGRTVFLVENLLSQIQFPAHVVAASTEEAAYPVWRVATGRRGRGDRWTPSADNTEAWIQVDCGAATAASMVALDRGHNLAGRAVVLEGSADGAAWTSVVGATIPATASDAAELTAAHGAHTEEGAWVRQFGEASYRYWRLRIPAMGAGLRPEVVGLWLGRSWTPELYLDLPYSDHALRLGGTEHESDAGWVAIGQIKRGRVGEISLKLSGEAEYELHARYHIERHFWRRRPMWIVFDSARAERAVLALPRAGEYGFAREEGWGPRQTRISWAEHEPKLS